MEWIYRVTDLAKLQLQEERVDEAEFPGPPVGQQGEAVLLTLAAAGCCTRVHGSVLDL